MDVFFGKNHTHLNLMVLRVQPVMDTLSWITDQQRGTKLMRLREELVLRGDRQETSAKTRIKHMCAVVLHILLWVRLRRGLAMISRWQVAVASFKLFVQSRGDRINHGFRWWYCGHVARMEGDRTVVTIFADVYRTDSPVRQMTPEEK